MTSAAETPAKLVGTEEDKSEQTANAVQDQSLDESDRVSLDNNSPTEHPTQIETSICETDIAASNPDSEKLADPPDTAQDQADEKHTEDCNEVVEVESEHQGGAKLKISTRRKSSPDPIVWMEMAASKTATETKEGEVAQESLEDGRMREPDLPPPVTEEFETTVDDTILSCNLPVDKESDQTSQNADTVEQAVETVSSDVSTITANTASEEIEDSAPLSDKNTEFMSNTASNLDKKLLESDKSSKCSADNDQSKTSCKESSLEETVEPITLTGTDSNDISKTKTDSSGRNVFDVFPVDAESIKLKQYLTSQNVTQASNCGDMSVETNNSNTNTDFLSSFEKFLKNQDVEITTAPSTVSATETTSSIDTKKRTVKPSSKPKKVYKRNQSESPAPSGVIQEQDILKKAKERYPYLKELRVSLTTDDIKDRSDSPNSPSERPSRTVERNFIGRSVKSKISNDKIMGNNKRCGNVNETVGDDGRKSTETLESANNGGKGDGLQNKASEHSFDKDCAKPLKKRSRRGGEELKNVQADTKDKSETVVKGKPADISVPINPKATDSPKVCISVDPETNVETSESPEEKKDVKCDEKSGAQEIGENSPELAENNGSKTVATKKSSKSKRKGKGRSRSKSKKTTSSSEIKPKNKIESNINNSHSHVHVSNDSGVKNNTELVGNKEPISDNKETRSSISGSDILKKYPGRSCKLRNQPLANKHFKLKASVKTAKKEVELKKAEKDVPKQTESEVIVKIKKKRRKKVKPWSWGNEKKKYKPKPKSNVESNPDINDAIPEPVEETVEDEDESVETADKSCDIPEVGESNSCLVSVNEEMDLNSQTISETIRQEPQHPEDTCLESHIPCKPPRANSKKRKRSKSRKRPKSKVVKTAGVAPNADSVENDIKEKQSKHDVIDQALTDTKLSETVVETVVVSKDRTVNESCASGSSANVDEKSFVESVAESLTHISKGNAKKSISAHKGRPRKKSRRKNVKTKVLSEPDIDLQGSSSSDKTNDQENPNPSEVNVAHLEDNEQGEGEVNENHANINAIDQPDSGIQSLAGSPAGNESPNSVIIVNLEQGTSNGTSVSTNSTAAADNSEHLSCVSQIQTLKNGLVTSTVGVMTASVKPSTETISCSQTVPVPTVSASTSNINLWNDISESPSSEFDIFSKYDNQTMNVEKNSIGAMLSSNLDVTKESLNSQSVSPSKKKNRAKFLHLHKTSTLLQKGRLPTEKEKEYRLEDKFDYLGKAGASSVVCDNDTMPSKSETVSDIGKPTSENESNSKHISEKSTPNMEKCCDINLIESPASSKKVNPKKGKRKRDTSSAKHASSVENVTVDQAQTGNSKSKIEKTAASVDTMSAKQGKTDDTINQTERHISTVDGLSAKKDKTKNNKKQTEKHTPESLSVKSTETNEFTSKLKDHNSEVVSTMTCLTSVASSPMISVISNSINHSSITSTVTTTCSSIAPSNSVVTCQSIIGPVTSVTASVGVSRSKGQVPESSDNKDVDRGMEDLPSKHVTVTKTNKAMDMVNSKNKIKDKTDKVTSKTHLRKHDEGIFVESEQAIDPNITLPVLSQRPLKRKPGRPPTSKNKKFLTLHKIKDRIISKVKHKRTGRPTLLKKFDFSVKRKRGRPKGSKNKLKHIVNMVKDLGRLDSNTSDGVVANTNKPIVIHKPRGRPKGALNKVKKVKPVPGLPCSPEKQHVLRKDLSPPESAKKATPQIHSLSPVSNFSAPPMMQWRESRVIETEEKKKRGPGRPRKNPLKVPGEPKIKKKRAKIPKLKKLQRDVESNFKDQIEMESIEPHVTTTLESCEFTSQNFNAPVQILDLDEAELETQDEDNAKTPPKIRKSKLHPLMKKKGKRGRKKGFKVHLKRSAEHDHAENDIRLIPESPFPEREADFSHEFPAIGAPENQPARSVSSQDSDTSGAGSSLGTRSSIIQMWMEMNRLKKKKNKKKLLYFRSKHKNIIDPVFVAEVDFMIDSFPDLAISPPGETFIKVRPGEVPLPSIFKIVRINVKKKKKDKLFVFEKARPLKPKNELESAAKDKIKLGRKIGMLGDHFLDLVESHGQQQHQPCYLPPKKRHKLFSTLGIEGFSTAEGHYKLEKRKAGRPRKVRPPSPSSAFPFGDVQKKKDGYKMGRESTEAMASFASVAAMSGQSSPTFAALSPEKDNTVLTSMSTLSTFSPAKDSVKYDKQQVTKSPIPNVSKSLTSHVTKSPISNVTKSTVSNVTKSSVSNVTKSAVSNVTKSTVSNVTKSTVSNVTKSLVSNVTKSTVLNVTKSTVSNVTKSPVSNVTKSTVSNVINSSVSNERKSPERKKHEKVQTQNKNLSHMTRSCDSCIQSGGQTKPSHDHQIRSTDVSCDKCLALQASDSENPGAHKGSHLPNSNKTSSTVYNKNVKRLKRKYRKSGKLSFTHLKKTKTKVAQSVESHPTRDRGDIEDLSDTSVTSDSVNDRGGEEHRPNSSVRSVCSESEPLPTIYQDKRKYDSDSEDELVKKKAKLHKRRVSDASQESDASIVKKQPGPVFQKKKFQKAGLYSDSYKDDDKSKDKDSGSTYLTFDLPLHFGQHIMKNATDFQLPYDIWWLHFNDMLPKKGDGQQYRRIRNNIYVDARPVCRYEAHTCSCKRPVSSSEKGCGEDCLNKLIYTECSPDQCPCGEQCGNQSIQKHHFAPGLQKFLTKDRGFGVRTTKPIKSGDLIMEYLGEVVSEQEFRRRMTEEYSQECHHYCLNLDRGTVIDGYRMGNVARFVNHSCEPNCEMQKWNVNGTYHMCLFALDNVEPGTELVYDYNFQSFNHDAQQMCRCGSQNCRGIIGGKKQRYNGQGTTTEKSKLKGKHPKRKSKNKVDKNKDTPKTKYAVQGHQYTPGGIPMMSNQHFSPYLSPIPVKPISKKERLFARRHTIFLVRNLDRIRDGKHQSEHEEYKDGKEDDYVKGTHFTKKDVFMTQLTALNTSRSMKTRRLTLAEEDTELSSLARLAGVCKEIYSAITSSKDEDSSFLATDLYHLPSKKKHPWYYQVIDEPIDLTMIQHKIMSADYSSIDAFETDMLKLFSNVETYCGKKSEMGEKIKQLRLIYNTAKQERMSQLNEMLGQEAQTDGQTGALSDADSSDIIQASTPTTSSESDLSEVSDNKGEWMQAEDDEEEIIRCICGIYKDEGLMIQCEKCYIWQHTDCMRVKGDEDNYLCDQCDPRPVNREVEIVPNSDEDEEAVDDGNHYFMTLMRDDMQIRLGSCVYVTKENQSRRYSYKKSGGLNKDKMDIFRLERLWMNQRGEKFAFGHMYVKPEETFHEPNRRFFPNEVFRTPLYEVVQLESITGYCCVMDLLTFCKGRPKGYKEEDLYICEYRMDKTLHLFYKMSAKQRYAINTKSYCFEMYEKRLNPRRTYSPHEVPEAYKRNWREKSAGSSAEDGGITREKKSASDEEEDIPLVKVKIERRKEKRDRVNKFVEALSKGIISPSKKRSDLSYLLSDSRKLHF